MPVKEIPLEGRMTRPAIEEAVAEVASQGFKVRLRFVGDAFAVVTAPSKVIALVILSIP